MKMSEIHPVIQHCLGCHQAFRKLGFAGDKIFVGVCNGVALVILRDQDKEFSLGAAETDLSPEEFAKLWTVAGDAMNAHKISIPDIASMFFNSVAFKQSIQFTAAMVAKGFEFPRTKPEFPRSTLN